MNNTEIENKEVLEKIATNLSLIEEHFGNISKDIGFIVNHFEENTPKTIKQLSYIAENTANIL